MEKETNNGKQFIIEKIEKCKDELSSSKKELIKNCFLKTFMNFMSIISMYNIIDSNHYKYILMWFSTMILSMAASTAALKPIIEDVIDIVSLKDKIAKLEEEMSEEDVRSRK